jgi:hypothetical protein
MKNRMLLVMCCVFIFAATLKAQPFADIVTFNYQTFSAPYKVFDSIQNRTDNYFLNLFIPKEFKNGNVFLFRINSEYLNTMPASSKRYAVASISLPIGFQLTTNNKKWKTVLIAIPKIASDFRDKIDKQDWQMGGIFLQNYVYSDHLKIKAGLYYNREAFGNFFMPLAAIDWRVNDRLNFYGILPTNYKAEFNLIKNKLYTGLNFKSYTRSFRLSQNENNDYVRYNEIQLKLFLDYFVYKKILLFGDVGYALGKSPIQYLYKTNQPTVINPQFSQIKNGVVFNVGLAYRLRFDLNTESGK